MILRVIKIGGSLLSRPDLNGSFARWLARQAPAKNLIVVGGGELVNAIRDLDRVHRMDAEHTHWLCVETLSATFDIAAQILTNVNLIRTSDEFDRSHQASFVEIDGNDKSLLINVSSFYDPRRKASLPTDWRTTTDAIAAYLGTIVSADEVVLIKSCDLDGVSTPAKWVAEGLVDEAILAIAPAVRSIRLANLSP